MDDILKLAKTISALIEIVDKHTDRIDSLELKLKEIAPDLS